MNLTKGGRLCSQLEVRMKVVFVWYMLAPQRPELWKTSYADCGPSQVNCIYIRKCFAVSTGPRFRQKQKLTDIAAGNYTVCCSPAGTQHLDVLSFMPFSEHITYTQQPTFFFLNTSSSTGILSENKKVIRKERWFVACCYRYWWWSVKKAQRTSSFDTGF